MHVFLVSPRIIRPKGRADLRKKKKRMMRWGLEGRLGISTTSSISSKTDTRIKRFGVN